MFQFIEFIKQKINNRKKIKKQKLVGKEKEAKQILKQVAELMLSKPCPISKGACTKACIHFEQEFTFFHDKEFWISHPKCKLWK